MNRARTAVLALCLVLPAMVVARDPDPAEVRLQAELAALERDPSLGELAAAERIRARQALDVLAQARGKERRAAAVWAAERRVEIARAVAESEHLERQLAQLERERDRILLDASRRDAELARQEAEKLRLQNLARAEEAQRAQETAATAIALSEQSSAEAEQARRLAQAQKEEAALARQEAELASAAADNLRVQLQNLSARPDARGQVMTLAGDAFASGGAALLPEARANLQRVVEFVQRFPGKPVLIEGHTDSQGSANANQVLSQKRADAVRAALVEDGIEVARLSVSGVGEDRPVADNASANGRARNRRVEIIVQGAEN
ncbi:MAG: OmpA family protein [Chiayiivirga sp.]|jgi:outer membrane protein OmpA-like peptidoglycan-associated protein|uniref:OmpA family protein n=1 Tax=Chiayiivirga sp. TaxID=2041042 RepID=UPI0025C7020C|nr:OmpA family protein [Chiayiivirga sp.]MCI1728382.1 OmpA family protein [Chiayiivirga sp.]